MPFAGGLRPEPRRTAYRPSFSSVGAAVALLSPCCPIALVALVMLRALACPAPCGSLHALAVRLTGSPGVPNAYAWPDVGTPARVCAAARPHPRFRARLAGC